MKNELITINKNNEIETTLLEEKVNDILVRIKDVRNFAVHDQETKVKAKELQRDLKADFTELDNLRKDKQRQYTEPFKKLQKQFKEWDMAINNELSVLTKSIEEYETNQLNEKIKELEVYFDEVNDIEFLTYDNIGLNVTLSASVKSLTTQIDDFIERVTNDLAVIETQDNKERILVRYQSTLDLSNAITSVNEEVKKEKELIEVKEEPTIEKVVEVSKEEPIIKNTKQTEPFSKVMLFVECTDSQLTKLKEYMNSNGIRYRV